MNKEKRCIFHIPNYIDINRKSASNVRPLKMIEAFKENGYIVDIVMGYAKDRKKQIKQIKNNIKNGCKYDFMYSESSTMPTLLTEKHHLPLYPFLDFSLFKYCKKNGIKSGLFYRDLYWKFDVYKNLPILKRIFATFFYKYDLYKYKKLIDIIYTPSEFVERYLRNEKMVNPKTKIKLLPPGCDIKQLKENKDCNKKELNIFYVGGISEEVYNFEKFIYAINKLKDVNLTICCREDEWKKESCKFNKPLNNIKVIHANTNELAEYYKKADVCSLLFKNNEYINMAMNFKLFEYISYNKPIIATKGTAAGEFVEKNDIGWLINCEFNEIKELVNYLISNKNEIQRIKTNQKNIIEKHTWKARAKQVEEELKCIL